MPSFARLPMQYLDRLLCSCPLLIFTHAEFLFKTIASYPRDSWLSPTYFWASRLRCAHGYRHNDITILIIGNPSSPLNSADRWLRPHHFFSFQHVAAPFPDPLIYTQGPDAFENMWTSHQDVPPCRGNEVNCLIISKPNIWSIGSFGGEPLTFNQRGITLPAAACFAHLTQPLARCLSVRCHVRQPEEYIRFTNYIVLIWKKKQCATSSPLQLSRNSRFYVVRTWTVQQHTTPDPRHAEHSRAQGQPLSANVNSCSSTLLRSSVPLLDAPPVAAASAGGSHFLHTVGSPPAGSSASNRSLCRWRWTLWGPKWLLVWGGLPSFTSLFVRFFGTFCVAMWRSGRAVAAAKMTLCSMKCTATGLPAVVFDSNSLSLSEEGKNSYWLAFQAVCRDVSERWKRAQRTIKTGSCKRRASSWFLADLRTETLVCGDRLSKLIGMPQPQGGCELQVRRLGLPSRFCWFLLRTSESGLKKPLCIWRVCQHCGSEVRKMCWTGTWHSVWSVCIL